MPPCCFTYNAARTVPSKAFPDKISNDYMQKSEEGGNLRVNIGEVSLENRSFLGKSGSMMLKMGQNDSVGLLGVYCGSF